MTPSNIGGTAGAVVAARLAENPAFSVLLVEAGNKLSSSTASISAIFNTPRLACYPSTITHYFI